MAKELTVQEQRDLLANPIMQELKKFEIQQRMAQMFATSTIVPDVYKKNLGNCVIAIDMAMRMGTNPLATMQNLYIVQGKPSWATQFLVACVNKCGRFTPLDYEIVGDDPSKKNYKCRAFAYAKDDVKKEHPLYGTWITWPMVDGEGWSKKPGSKWLTMPEQMFRYRAAAFWARTFAPEISMGFPTQEETIDGAVIDVDAEVVHAPEPVKEEPAQEQTADVTDGADQGQNQDKEEVKEPAPAPEQPKPATPADAIQQAIKKQASMIRTGGPGAMEAAQKQANTPVNDKPGTRQEGNLFE